MGIRTRSRLHVFLMPCLLVAGLAMVASDPDVLLPDSAQTGPIFAVGWTPDSKVPYGVLGGSFDGKVTLWAFNKDNPKNSGRILATFSGSGKGMVLALAAYPDEAKGLIAAGNRDGSFQIWQRTDLPVRVVSGSKKVTAVALSD